MHVALALLASTEVCTPSTPCREQIHSWMLAHGGGFVPKHLGLKKITTMLPALLKCSTSEAAALIDVGAGIHGLGPLKMKAISLHEDDSDALWLLGAFGHLATVHAFESNPAKAAELREAAASRPFSRNFTKQLRVYAQGVGGTTRKSRVDICGTANAWGVKGVGERAAARCRPGPVINVTTLDDFADTLSAPILYVKVDVEGGELDIVKGMHRILSEQRVEIMSFEYALGWHKSYETKVRRPLTIAEREAAREHTLLHFSKIMFKYGYDTYLIHGRGRNVVLLPIYDSFWHPDFEICFDRGKIYGVWGQWCWNDVLVIRRGNSCVKKTLFDEILPATAAAQGKRATFWSEAQVLPVRKNTPSSAPFPACECL